VERQSQTANAPEEIPESIETSALTRAFANAMELTASAVLIPLKCPHNSSASIKLSKNHVNATMYSVNTTAIALSQMIPSTSKHSISLKISAKLMELKPTTAVSLNNSMTTRLLHWYALLNQ
jgi:hypothetical protein